MRMRVLIGCLAGLFLWSVGAADAQYLFLDTNGDGQSTSADVLSGSDSTSIDIWIATDVNRDGSKAVAAKRSATPLSIFSYEFILHATGGTLDWVSYTNLRPTMDFKFGEFKSKTYFYTGFSGGAPLPPGKYKLGTLVVRVTSGTPQIAFASQAPNWEGLQTSFGSMNPGKNGYNTLMYSEDPTMIANPSSAVPGDWGDADGVSVNAIQLASNKTPPLRFGVSIAPNPLNPEALITVSTTRAGFLRVRLFDVSGRLVRVLMDKDAVHAGSYKLRLSAEKQKMASGVFFYSVDASEGHLQGRVVVLK